MMMGEGDTDNTRHNLLTSMRGRHAGKILKITTSESESGEMFHSQWQKKDASLDKIFFTWIGDAVRLAFE